MTATMHLQVGLDVIRSYKRLPYKVWHALAEFIDNSTQSYVDNRGELDAAFAAEGGCLSVDIVYDAKDDLLRIADTAMGMDRDELTRALHVGLPPQDTSGRSEFGMGLKTAACWVGDLWTVQTKKLGSDVEYTVTVDVEAVAGGDPDLHMVERTGRPLEDHYTVIEVHRHHRQLQTRTLGKIKQYLPSIYRDDIRNGDLRLTWQGEDLVWGGFSDEDFLTDPAGKPYKKDFEFTLEGRRVFGWVGVLKKGSREKAGFSILRRERVIFGWPESWRPSTLYGQLEGSNDLVNQRLVGEINLDDFEVSHTKSDIQWMGDEEEQVEQALKESVWDYRETARTTRTRGADSRGPSTRDVQVAVDEIAEELASPEMEDVVTLEAVPPPEVVSGVVDRMLEGISTAEPVISAQISNLSVRCFLENDVSPNDPYIVLDSSQASEVIVVVNGRHPHFLQLEGSQGVANYLRHCIYDGLAEWQARQKAGTLSPETVKMLKDRLLRVPFDIDEHQASA